MPADAVGRRGLKKMGVRTLKTEVRVSKRVPLAPTIVMVISSGVGWGA